MPGWRNGIPACRQAGAHDTTMWYLYILKSINTGRFYKGLTGDLDERLKRHNAGRESATKTMLPLILIHVETCETRSEARKLEKFFKSGYGREVIKEIAE
ncbi:MAG: GIY-YIG nuclease family protein [Patescibacteria group bacterium]